MPPLPRSPTLPPPTSTKWSDLTTGRGVLVCVYAHTHTHTLVSTSVKATHCHPHNRPARLRPGSSPQETGTETRAAVTNGATTHTVTPHPGRRPHGIGVQPRTPLSIGLHKRCTRTPPNSSHEYTVRHTQPSTPFRAGHTQSRSCIRHELMPLIQLPK